MSGLDKTQGLLLSLEELRAGLLLNDARRIQLLEKLVFFSILGDSLRLPRSTSFGDNPLFDTVPLNPIGEGVAQPDDPQTSLELTSLVQDVFARDFVQANQSAVNDQLGVQIAAACVRFFYKLMDAFFNGNPGMEPGAAIGMDLQIAGANQLLPNDTTNFYLSLEDLARVADRITSGEGHGPIVAVVNAAGWVNILKAHYDRGVTPEWMELEFWDENGYFATRRVLSFRGIPILVDDHVLSNRRVDTFNDGTAVYVFRLGRGGVYLITPARGGAGAGAWSVAEAAPSLIDVRMSLVETESVSYARLTMPFAVVLESQSSAALLIFRPQPGTA